MNASGDSGGKLLFEYYIAFPSVFFLPSKATDMGECEHFTVSQIFFNFMWDIFVNFLILLSCFHIFMLMRFRSVFTEYFLRRQQIVNNSAYVSKK